MNDYSNYESDVFSCKYDGDTAIICLKANSFKMTTDPHHFHDMLDCMNSIEVDNKIKGILALHTVKFERIENMETFIQSIQKESGYVQKDDLSIEFPGLEIGVTPMGAVALFMSRQMGSTKALEILMSRDPVKAEEARELGFVTTVVAQDKVEEECRRRLEEMYKVPGVTLSLTKQLIRPKTYELEEHFELSSRLMWSSIVDN